MKIRINGSESEFDGPLTVTTLLAELDLGYPVLVELNGEALFPREFDQKTIKDGDQLELLRMVAGG